MGDKSKIEWTDATWNPIRAQSLLTGKPGWHCEHVTPGCENCYAERLNLRLGTGYSFKPGHRQDVRLFIDEKMLQAPLRWKRPRMIFVCSMSDLFADFVPDEWIDQVFAVMALSTRHTFQVLTKRSARMRAYVSSGAWERIKDQASKILSARARQDIRALSWDLPAWPLPNVWLGISSEDQQRADERIPDLLNTPAVVRFVSYEPALGPVDFTLDGLWNEQCSACADGCYHDPETNEPLCGSCDGSGKSDDIGIDWIIAGGESGPDARPANPQWFRDVRDQCETARVAFFMKQLSSGGYQPIKEISAFPVDLQIRDYPKETQT